MARLTGDIDVIQYALTQGFVYLITDLATLLIIIGWLFFLEWRLALLTVIILPLYVLNYKLLLTRIRKVSVELRERWEKMISILTEKIGSIAVVKAFAHENYETESFMETVANNFKLSMEQTKLNRFLGATSQLIRMLGTGGLLWYGGAMVLGRQLKPGELLAFYSYIGYLYDPAVRVVDFNVQLQWANASIDRVFETLDTRPEIIDNKEAIHLPTVRGRIEFRNVTFGYDPEQPVVKDVSLRCSRGRLSQSLGHRARGRPHWSICLPVFMTPIPVR